MERARDVLRHMTVSKLDLLRLRAALISLCTPSFCVMCVQRVGVHACASLCMHLCVYVCVNTTRFCAQHHDAWALCTSMRSGRQHIFKGIMTQQYTYIHTYIHMLHTHQSMSTPARAHAKYSHVQLRERNRNSVYVASPALAHTHTHTHSH